MATQVLKVGCLLHKAGALRLALHKQQQQASALHMGNAQYRLQYVVALSNHLTRDPFSTATLRSYSCQGH